MPSKTILETQRLRLVPFAPEHLEAMFKMNSNPEVMKYLGPPETIEETEAGIERQQGKWARFGFGWWSVFERETGAFVGSACLQHLESIEGNPLEIGWRLIPEARGKGYATEAGRAAIDYGFDCVGVRYLVAVTDVGNTASARVMERLGMAYIGVQIHYGVPCLTYEIHHIP